MTIHSSGGDLLALIDQTLAPSSGSSLNNIKANLGSVKNYGFEALVNGQVLNRSVFARAVAIGTPLVLWASYFLAVQLRWGIAWPAELWAGSVVFAALGGFALSLLMVPPPAPPPPSGPGEA